MTRRSDELFAEILVALSPEGTAERLAQLREEKAAPLAEGWAALHAARAQLAEERAAFEAREAKLKALLAA